MAYVQEKTKGKKIVSFKFKACLGRDANGKQIFKCWTWYPPADLTPAKARKEAERVAGRWEEEQRLAFSQQKAEEETAPPAPVYTFDTLAKATGAGFIGGLIGGDGMRHKTSNDYKAAQSTKSTAQKVFGKVYGNSQTPAKLLSRAIKMVQTVGYQESLVTGAKFIAGSVNAQILTRIGTA